MGRLFDALLLQRCFYDGGTETKNQCSSARLSIATQPKPLDCYIRIASRDHGGRGTLRMVQSIRTEPIRQTEVQKLRVFGVKKLIKIFNTMLSRIFCYVYSMPSALWAMWGLLCGALVNFKAPKSWPNKFLINVWGGFCVIFVASYTANIAALIASLLFQNAQVDYNDRNVSVYLYYQNKRRVTKLSYNIRDLFLDVLDESRINQIVSRRGLFKRQESRSMATC